MSDEREIPADVLAAAIDARGHVRAVAYAILAERERCAADAARIDWLEAKHTLHRKIDILYVVDGYKVTETHDYEPISQPSYGETLRDAIDAAMQGTKP